MAELIEILKSWILKMGNTYGVNPVVFGSIYLGAIPFFTASVAWLIRNYRSKRSIVLPFLCSLFFFISAYLYLVIAGKNVPWWVYGIVSGMVVYGAWTVYSRVRKKLTI